jgi:hypothetical protein
MGVVRRAIRNLIRSPLRTGAIVNNLGEGF